MMVVDGGGDCWRSVMVSDWGNDGDGRRLVLSGGNRRLAASVASNDRRPPVNCGSWQSAATISNRGWRMMIWVVVVVVRYQQAAINGQC